MSEVLGSFSADRAALYIANRNCKPNGLSLVFRKDGFSICFLIYKKVTGKYEKMIADHGSPSWKLKCIVAEVGCRGYIPPSFRKALQHFGFTSKELKKLVDECSLVSRRSSYYIWLNRFHQSFIPFQMVQIDIAAYKSIAVV